MQGQISTGANFSYPSSSAAVVFGGHLSARAVFRLDRKSPAISICVWLPYVIATNLRRTLSIFRRLIKEHEKFKKGVDKYKI
jgi:hypothetical protein